jgi:DNA (cytosine-5)-methyltransferase 1
MRYISLFSGLEGATLAWHHLGWECVATAEIEPAACAVLAAHYPDVPNLGDISKVTEQQIQDLGHIDIVVFGSPCQDVSIAGKREGMEGSRSGLFFTAMRVVRWSGARFALWENVPGVFSDHQGRGFASVVGEMAGIHVDVPKSGWRNSGFLLGTDALVEWAVLDAQFFGVPQRRRRVFALRDSGDWASRTPILLESESLQGHPAPRRESGQVAPTIPARSLGGGGLGSDFDCDGGAIEVCMSTGQGSAEIGIGTTLNCNHESPIITAPLKQNPYADNESRDSLLVTHSLSADGFDASEDGTGRGTPFVPISFDCKSSGRNGFGIGKQSPTLRSMGRRDTHQSAGGGHVAVMTLAIRGREGEPSLEVRDDGTANAVLTPNGGRAGIGVGAVAIGWSEELTASCELAGTVQRGGTGGRHEGVMTPSMAVRRLTPRECERLQGVPDDYTRIPHPKYINKGDKFGTHEKFLADGPRYKMLGNGFAVPVVRWIGERLAKAVK